MHGITTLSQIPNTNKIAILTPKESQKTYKLIKEALQLPNTLFLPAPPQQPLMQSPYPRLP